MIKEFLNETWEQEFIQLLVGFILFALGFLVSSLKEYRSERKKSRSERIYFETRLLKFLNELNVLRIPHSESNVKDTNQFVSRFTILKSNTLQEISLVDQVKLFHEYVGKAKKGTRKTITQDYDLLMLSLDAASRLYDENKEYNSEYRNRYHEITIEWNNTIREIDEMYSELLGKTNVGEIKELGFAKKFVELRTKSYAEQIKKPINKQFTIDSVNRNFIIPLRTMVHEYTDANYAERLIPSLIKLEEEYRKFELATKTLMQNDETFSKEIKSIMGGIADFMNKWTNSNLKKYGY